MSEHISDFRAVKPRKSTGEMSLPEAGVQKAIQCAGMTKD
jgi:hypothetical protein